MSRTKRNVYRRLGGWEKRTLDIEFANADPDTWWYEYLERCVKLYGTETTNWGLKTHEYFNRAHRLGRADARDQLRPQRVLSEDYDFDPSRYKSKLKGVWWDIY